MFAHKMTVTVSSDHRVAITLPAGFPPGEAEVIVIATLPDRAAEKARVHEASPAPGASERRDPEALARFKATLAEVAMDARPIDQLSQEEKRARLETLRGVASSILSPSDELIRRQQEEIDLEDRDDA